MPAIDTTPTIIRPATAADLPRLTEIYNHYIINTPTTFDTEPFTVEQRAEWFSHYADTGRHRILVAETAGAAESFGANAGTIAGYTTSSRFHPRAAYDTTVELTILCAPESVGHRIGQKLYEALFDALRGEDIHAFTALITLPNRASCDIHERFGFTRMGVLKEAGRKFNKYWDVAYYQKVLT